MCKFFWKKSREIGVMYRSWTVNGPYMNRKRTVNGPFLSR